MENKKKYVLLLKDLGSRIKLLRLNKGMSQTELGMKCDMEKAAVSRIEAGMINTSVATLCRLCEALEITIKELF